VSRAALPDFIPFRYAAPFLTQAAGASLAARRVGLEAGGKAVEIDDDGLRLRRLHPAAIDALAELGGSRVDLRR
jgi:hypothetical protein